MKKYSAFLLGAAVAFAACSTDSDLDENGSDGTGSDSSSSAIYSSSLTDLTSFDVAIDTTSLAETETVPEDNEDYLENNTFSQEVGIVFDGTSASCTSTVDGVSVSISGADVVVTSTVKKVHYTVSGSTSDGFLKIYSDYKFCLELAGVSITNPDGAALNIQSKKRGFIVLQDGTTNTLTDGTSYADETSSEDMKATLFSEGKLLFSGAGKLRVYANCKAGIRSDDYIQFRPGNNVYVAATSGNGIKGKDGLYIRGGAINVETSATSGKAFSSDSHIVIDGGRVVGLTTGTGSLDDDGLDVSGAAAFKADSTFTLNAGAVYCKSTGAGGKGINANETLDITGGTLRVITTGKQYTYGSLSAAPKGIKSDGAMTISGGDIMVRCTGGEDAEGLESKSTMTITGGTIQAYCYDDALNSSGAMTISGGTVFALGTNNDAIDSNSTLTISGGTVIASGTTVPEAGFDCDENTFTITGGTLIGLGGTTSTPTASVTTQPVAILSGSSLSSGTYITVASSDGTNILTFKSPRDYTSQGYTLLVSSPSFVQGSTYTVATGAEVSGGTDFCGYVTGADVSGGTTVASLTLSSIVTSYGSSSSQPGGQGGGGRH